MASPVPSPPPSPARRAPTRALWAVCVVAFLAFGALWPLHAATYHEWAWDFRQFYIAAHLPVRDLYNRAAYLDMARRLFEHDPVRHYPPFVRPAVFALALRPLAWFPFWTAFGLWCAVQLGAYGLALYLLRRIYPYPPEALLGWALFYPPMHGLWEGQDAPMVLLAALGAFLLLRSGRDRAAGLAFGLCVYKFNLFLLLPLYLLRQRRWTLLRTALAGVALLAAASAALASPAAYTEFLRHIPEMTIGFGPETMPGWRAWTAAQPLAYLACVAVTAIACWWGIRQADASRGFAIALSGSLLISPHVTWYDLSLLAIPISLGLSLEAWWRRIPSLVLLVGIPLWFGPARYVALLVGLLLINLLTVRADSR